MPRSTEEILAQADELAKRFEDYEPDSADRDKVSPETRLRLAALKRAEVEREVTEAVAGARAHEMSWAKIGHALGTSGQSANERYSSQVKSLIRKLELAGELALSDKPARKGSASGRLSATSRSKSGSSRKG